MLSNDVLDDFIANPEWKSGFEYYDMTREERMEHWFERINRIAATHRNKYFNNAENFGMWTSLHLG